MINVLLVEDDDVLRKACIKCLYDVDPDIIIFEAINETGAMDIAKKNRIDFFILDALLADNSNGFELAAGLRDMKEYRTTPLMFETSEATKQLDVVNLHYCHFLTKPFTWDEFKKAVKNVLLIIRRQGPVLTIGEHVQIYTKKLIYIECIKHMAKVVTVSGYEEVRASAKELVERLDGGFIRCHKSFIVNADYISHFDTRYITLIGLSEKIKIGRFFKNSFQKEYKTYSYSTLGIRINRRSSN